MFYLENLITFLAFYLLISGRSLHGVDILTADLNVTTGNATNTTSTHDNTTLSTARLITTTKNTIKPATILSTIKSTTMPSTINTMTTASTSATSTICTTSTLGASTAELTAAITSTTGLTSTASSTNNIATIASAPKYPSLPADQKIFKYIKLTRKSLYGHLLVSWDIVDDYVMRQVNYSLISEYFRIGDCADSKNLSNLKEDIPLQNMVRSYELQNVISWSSMAVTLKGVDVASGKTDYITESTVTHETAPSGKPINIHPVSIQPQSAQMAWEPPVCEERGGLLVRYEVELTNVASPNSPKPLIASTDYIALMSLTPFTQYQIRVRYVNSAGAGPYSNHYVFQTGQGLPGAPIIYNFTDDDISIGVVIVLPNQQNGQIDQYNIELTGGINHMTELYTPLNGSEYIIGNLMPNTTYLIRARARNAAGWGDWSKLIQVQTKAEIKPTPVALRQIYANKTCIGFQWAPPDADHHLVHSYEIRVFSNNDMTLPYRTYVSKDSNDHVQCGLNPYTQYSVSVSVMKDTGQTGHPLGARMWTEGKTPPKPRPPVIRKETSTTVTLEMFPVLFDSGPITSYEIRLLKLYHNHTREPHPIKSSVFGNDVPLWFPDDKTALPEPQLQMGGKKEGQHEMSQVSPLRVDMPKIVPVGKRSANVVTTLTNLKPSDHRLAVFLVTVPDSRSRACQLLSWFTEWKLQWLSATDRHHYQVFAKSVVEISREGCSVKESLIRQVLWDLTTRETMRVQGEVKVRGKRSFGNPPGVLWLELLDKDITEASFWVIGDEQFYHGRRNIALEPNTEYVIIFVVKSTVVDVTKHAYSLATTTAYTYPPESEWLTSTQKLILLCLLVPFFAFMFCLFGFFVIRRLFLGAKASKNTEQCKQKVEREITTDECYDVMEDDEECTDDYLPLNKKDARELSCDKDATKLEQFFNPTQNVGQPRYITPMRENVLYNDFNRNDGNNSAATRVVNFSLDEDNNSPDEQSYGLRLEPNPPAYVDIGNINNNKHSVQRSNNCSDGHLLHAYFDFDPVECMCSTDVNKIYSCQDCDNDICSMGRDDLITVVNISDSESDNFCQISINTMRKTYDEKSEALSPVSTKQSSSDGSGLQCRKYKTRLTSSESMSDRPRVLTNSTQLKDGLQAGRQNSNNNSSLYYQPNYSITPLPLECTGCWHAAKHTFSQSITPNRNDLHKYLLINSSVNDPNLVLSFDNSYQLHVDQMCTNYQIHYFNIESSGSYPCRQSAPMKRLNKIYFQRPSLIATNDTSDNAGIHGTPCNEIRNIKNDKKYFFSNLTLPNITQHFQFYTNVNIKYFLNRHNEQGIITALYERKILPKILCSEQMYGLGNVDNRHSEVANDSNDRNMQMASITINTLFVRDRDVLKTKSLAYSCPRNVQITSSANLNNSCDADNSDATHGYMQRNSSNNFVNGAVCSAQIRAKSKLCNRLRGHSFNDKNKHKNISNKPNKSSHKTVNCPKLHDKSKPLGLKTLFSGQRSNFFKENGVKEENHLDKRRSKSDTRRGLSNREGVSESMGELVEKSWSEKDASSNNPRKRGRDLSESYETESDTESGEDTESESGETETEDKSSSESEYETTIEVESKIRRPRNNTDILEPPFPNVNYPGENEPYPMPFEQQLMSIVPPPPRKKWYHIFPFFRKSVSHLAYQPNATQMVTSMAEPSPVKKSMSDGNIRLVTHSHQLMLQNAQPIQYQQPIKCQKPIQCQQHLHPTQPFMQPQPVIQSLHFQQPLHPVEPIVLTQFPVIQTSANTRVFSSLPQCMTVMPQTITSAPLVSPYAGPRRNVNWSRKTEIRSQRSASQYVSFRDEFLSLENFKKCLLRKLSFTTAQRNLDRNRFQYILAPDHSRVNIEMVAAGDADYYNASYMYLDSDVQYIAAQTPFSPITVSDFWRMVLQNKVETIVMLCACVEGGVMKSEQYWADTGVYAGGHVLVETISQKCYANYVIRTLKLSAACNIEVNVTQFQFFNWPLCGVPDDPIPFLELRYRVRSYYGNKTSPILVCCGTGVARSAVYISVDQLIEEYGRDGCVNVYKFVKKMRRSRPFMVRNLSQYRFIFECIFEEFQAGDTVLRLDMKQQYHALCQKNPQSDFTYLMDQFRILSQFTPDLTQKQCYVGLLQSNTGKNVDQRILPPDSYRPYSQVNEGEPSSWPYINAVIINGYRRRNEYIVTQTPLINTCIDFWKMVHDYQVQTIVMFGKCRGLNQEQYFPKTAGRQFGIFYVEHINTSKTDTVTTRNFKLCLTGNSGIEKRALRHFQVKQWDEGETLPVRRIDQFPNSMEVMLDLIDNVLDWQVIANRRTKPIVVVCTNGATLSGLFVSCAVVCEKMREDKEVDLYHSVKHIKRRRPGIISDFGQYRFLHQVLWHYIVTYLPEARKFVRMGCHDNVNSDSDNEVPNEKICHRFCARSPQLDWRTEQSKIVTKRYSPVKQEECCPGDDYSDTQQMMRPRREKDNTSDRHTSCCARSKKSSQKPATRSPVSSGRSRETGSGACSCLPLCRKKWPTSQAMSSRSCRFEEDEEFPQRNLHGIRSELGCPSRQKSGRSQVHLFDKPKGYHDPDISQDYMESDNSLTDDKMDEKDAQWYAFKKQCVENEFCRHSSSPNAAKTIREKYREQATSMATTPRQVVDIATGSSTILSFRGSFLGNPGNEAQSSILVEEAYDAERDVIIRELYCRKSRDNVHTRSKAGSCLDYRKSRVISQKSLSNKCQMEMLSSKVEKPSKPCEYQTHLSNDEDDRDHPQNTCTVNKNERCYSRPNIYNDEYIDPCASVRFKRTCSKDYSTERTCVTQDALEDNVFLEGDPSSVPAKNKRCMLKENLDDQSYFEDYDEDVCATDSDTTRDEMDKLKMCPQGLVNNLNTTSKCRRQTAPKVSLVIKGSRDEESRRNSTMIDHLESHYDVSEPCHNEQRHSCKYLAVNDLASQGMMNRHRTHRDSVSCQKAQRNKRIHSCEECKERYLTDPKQISSHKTIISNILRPVAMQESCANQYDESRSLLGQYCDSPTKHKAGSREVVIVGPSSRKSSLICQDKRKNVIRSENCDDVRYGHPNSCGRNTKVPGRLCSTKVSSDVERNDKSLHQRQSQDQETNVAFQNKAECQETRHTEPSPTSENDFTNCSRTRPLPKKVSAATSVEFVSVQTFAQDKSCLQDQIYQLNSRACSRRETTIQEPTAEESEEQSCDCLKKVTNAKPSEQLEESSYHPIARPQPLCGSTARARSSVSAYPGTRPESSPQRRSYNVNKDKPGPQGRVFKCSTLKSVEIDDTDHDTDHDLNTLDDFSFMSGHDLAPGKTSPKKSCRLNQQRETTRPTDVNNDDDYIITIASPAKDLGKGQKADSLRKQDSSRKLELPKTSLNKDNKLSSKAVASRTNENSFDNSTVSSEYDVSIELN